MAAPGVVNASIVQFFPPPPAASSVPLKHIVLIVMENHAYDNYFGTYCLNLSTYCPSVGNGIPFGTAVAKYPNNLSAGYVHTFAFKNDAPYSFDLAHAWTSSHQAYANGTNEDFYVAEDRGNTPFGEFDGATLPGYWDLAEQYGLGDSFYSSALSYSLPNHWYILAGGAPKVSETNQLQGTTWNLRHTYLDQANHTSALNDQLRGTGINWTYYDYVLPTYQQAISRGAGQGSAFTYWLPLAGKAESYTSPFVSHFVSRSQVLSDATNGTLPGLSWVIPMNPFSEHPPYNVSLGETWVANILQAAESGPEWNSTAVFVTWDEYGGFYDHVPPIQVDAYGYGFRVPLLVVSPYARMGYINHDAESFTSLLRFMEWQNNLATLTPRDTASNLPLRYFDFAAAPRPMLNVSLSSTTRYPTGFQGLPAPLAPLNLTATPVSGGINLSWSETSGGTAPAAYLLTFGPGAHPAANSARLDGAADGAAIYNLTSNVSYKFSLQALAGNKSSASTSVKGTPLTAIGPPHAVLGAVLDPRFSAPVAAVGTLLTSTNRPRSVGGWRYS